MISTPRLAVIIPAYNESERILPTLERLAEYFSNVDYSWKVVVISDGSKDNTGEIVKQFASEHSGFELDEYHPNRGKGFAVRKGMIEQDAEF